MRVFLTGATGFIGSLLVPELINAGHHVVGRSLFGRGRCWTETSRSGGLPRRRERPGRLRIAAEAAEGVIHAAFNHDFSILQQHSEDDRKVIETLGEARQVRIGRLKSLRHRAFVR